MADAVTATYNLVKPQVEASEDTWGDKLNKNFDDIDALLANRIVKSKTGRDGEEGGGTEADNPQFMELHLYLPIQTDGATIDTDYLDEEDPNYEADLAKPRQRSATTARWVETRIALMLNQFFPIGTILLWSGSFENIPAGWTLCDGNNGTPNLTDRIVLAAGLHSGHAPGQFSGNVGPGLGSHKHQTMTPFYAGVVGAPIVQSDYDGIALYDGGSTTLPYYAVVYIMKHAAWTV